ncbi:hypothetical protein AC249_AIPGENE15065 [Exaiptasia diaphana]|nr:hypothetical protein AC249_AIPGENE15065 [Exaiptasia diaphana]
MAQILMWFSLFVLSHCIFKVFSVVSSPGEIKTVEHKEARFLWNASSSIDEAKWGLVDGGIVAPFFIRVNKNIGEQKSVDLDKNTSKAFHYKNRVHFIGNISRGWAWFVITNLSTDDSKEYAADIKESTGIFTVYRVRLTVCK